jgi:hypothetical protein
MSTMHIAVLIGKDRAASATTLKQMIAASLAGQ